MYLNNLGGGGAFFFTKGLGLSQIRRGPVKKTPCSRLYLLVIHTLQGNEEYEDADVLGADQVRRDGAKRKQLSVN